MTCFYCKGEMKEGFTLYTAELKNCIVVIKNVPCSKCEQCGETVINGETALKIEKILKIFTEIATEVAIVDFSTAA